MRKSDFAQLLTEEGDVLHREGAAIVPWNTYPRPQMKRDSFFCLNGVWEFRENDNPPETILVPFPPESLLSGIGRNMGRNSRLTYTRTFTLPNGFRKDRVLLHFGAVDQIAEITLNGNLIGTHAGGYDSFFFDITESLKEKNTLTVYITDELHKKILPYGKQCEKRGGMWYTPVTGIWQTVWLESVPLEYVRSLNVDTVVSAEKSVAVITANGVTDGTVTVSTPEGSRVFSLTDGKTEIVIENPRLWSPEDPWLYNFVLRTDCDEIRSYFAFRSLKIKTVCGIPRLLLNGKPYFFHGLLDQGYWSDGLFTPASPVCYEKDILQMKALGFNTLRKHIKVEPEQFYYDCDRLGIIVFQDMVNNGDYSFLRDTALPTIGLKRLPDRWMHPNKPTRAAFVEGMERTVRQLRNHPSVCYWTIFNEGWGQFDGGAMYKRLKELDNTRFIDTTSGWFKGAPSDVESPHIYFKSVKLKPSDKPIVLSEFGGYACKVEEHAFNPDKTYGYRKYDTMQEFEDAFTELYESEILLAVKQGLCAAVYTQVSDVEDETNGLLTYDRWVMKVDRERICDISRRLKLRIN